MKLLRKFNLNIHLFIGIVCLTMLLSCSQDKPKNNLPPPPKPKTSYAWAYTEKMDSVTLTNDHYATINTLNYDTVSCSLSVRNIAGKNTLALSLLKGNFAGIKKVKIRFDDSRAQNYACEFPSKSISNILLIHPANELIQKLKKSKKLIVEANVDNEGLKLLFFNVEKLNWDYKSVYIRPN